ncbi:DUF5602 domain-containing protein [Chroococcidiopsis sp. CCNUC1]|uniref:DUF5602 domain-containing protein n=1 Tax=Chroococcidiopsis sp. CCNUC1 TaxID=2653189 RepID=UPI002022929C|nr:DUF5602 domain-containing protein [Chroococcidiopsis sp. CCNUC1]URD53416.1 DUF5602 domain-containing protein [Chroococcidiopsis sp. CCNUC1]
MTNTRFKSITNKKAITLLVATTIVVIFLPKLTDRIANFFSALTLRTTNIVTAPKLKQAVQIYSKPEQLGNGVIRSFITLDAKKNPSTIGVTFTKEALSNLPATPREYELSLPPEASASAFRYVVITWNLQGHQPLDVYNPPHFDFHFYSLGAEERKKITANGDDLIKVYKAPLKKSLPTDYIPEPTNPAPGEGRHWVDSKSSEFRGLPFTKTFIYGTYNGEIVFGEPMLTKSWLETQPNFTEAIKLPEAYSKSAYYPTSYSVKYDRTQQVYTVSLDRLMFRSSKSF